MKVLAVRSTWPFLTFMRRCCKSLDVLASGGGRKGATMSLKHAMKMYEVFYEVFGVASTWRWQELLNTLLHVVSCHQRR